MVAVADANLAVRSTKMGRGIPRPLLHLALLLSLLWLPQAIPKVDVKGPCGSMKSRILRGRQAGGLHSKQAFERETMLPETLRGCLLPRQGVLVLRGGEPMDDDWTGAGPGARTESKQSRKLQLQKARWKRKYRGVDDDESTGLSSEDERHEDRPDVYKPPIEAPPPVCKMIQRGEVCMNVHAPRLVGRAQRCRAQMLSMEVVCCLSPASYCFAAG